MRIACIDIQNFRKLKSCRVELSDKETLFVGANNSGKTSAMDALILFLKKSKRKDISTTDFTLSNWVGINKIGSDWVTNDDPNTLDLSSRVWESLMPVIDVWLYVEDNEIHYVSDMIPTLGWAGGILGIRLILEPDNIEELYKSYKSSYDSAKNTADSRKKEPDAGEESRFSLWPQSMHDYMDKELHKHFSVRAYILDPGKYSDKTPQDIPEGSEPLDGDPFEGLFKIDIINAQRGFSDPNSGESSSHSDRRLSVQLRKYFDKHLNPTELPNSNDLDALEAIEAAKTAFDAKLKTSFHPAISELEGLNYPGFSDPQIVLSSKINPIEGLDHDTAVQFHVGPNPATPGSGGLYLPEKYNGLGYQNLISMVFNLIRFRDEWMRVGKAGEKDENTIIEPLHIVLIEEPEAHLHAQVQQVFIKKAFNVLRGHKDLGKSNRFNTQMVVSTHSSHIAHEIDFRSLRYFKRMPAVNLNEVPCAAVVNLTTTFGDESDTSKFATRYLKTTHCDLFFADAAILVEGPAERMLVPHFVRTRFPELDKCYITLLEIGGSHAHRLKPLIENLGLLTLVVTDLDSIGATDNGKVRPKLGNGYRTGNDSIKTWAPCKTNLDDVLGASDSDKLVSDENVMVTYQYAMSVSVSGGKSEEVIPYTFEDALAFANYDFFKGKTSSTGLIKKISDATNKPTLDEACEDMFEALKSGKKAEMALELLFTTEPGELNAPMYIQEGLEWLQTKLKSRNIEYAKNVAEGG